MKIFKIMILGYLLVSLSGCFTVRTVDNPMDRKCELVTKELELHYSTDVSKKAGGTDPRLVLPLLAVVPPITFIVSGSVSVVGNAVHWIEKKGRCSDDDVANFTSKANESVIQKGGQVVKDTDTFAGWLKNRDKP